MSASEGQNSADKCPPGSAAKPAWLHNHARGWALLIAAVATSCGETTPRTQVMLFVDADTEVRALTTALRLQLRGYKPGADDASGTETDSPYDKTFAPLQDTLGDGWPHRFAIAPLHGDATRSYDVVVSALAGERSVAVVRASSGFVARETLALQLRFEASCLHDASLNCSDTQTCEKGACVSSAIAATSLPTLKNLPANPGAQAGSGSVDPDPDMGTVASGVSSTAGAPAAGASGAGSAGNGAAAAAGNGGEAVCGDGHVNGDERCDPVSSCPTKATCTASDSCILASLSGDPSKCSAVCSLTPISACNAGDNCCPSGCDHASDSDCSSTCGDGVIDSGQHETCEASTATPCPTTCVDQDACTMDVTTGSPSTCNVVCTHVKITTASLDSDGCCPEAANANTDADCKSSCGNAVVEMGEACDGNCPSSAADCSDNIACTADRVTGTQCGRQCAHSMITMPSQTADGCCPNGANANNDADCAPVCGNSVIEPGEQCDGNCPSTAADCTDNMTCTVDRVTGTGCGRRCGHTASVPMSAADGCCPTNGNANNDADCPAECGNRVKEPGETCDDGNLTNGDGCSATCVPDDVTSTPGDDRAGYVTCGDMTCMPNFVCCAGTTQTCTLACGTISYKCDGAEDCPSGQTCWVFDGAVCTASASVGGQRCHTAAECLKAGATCSSSGYCSM